MEKMKLKAHLLEECKKLQQKVLDNLRNTMNEAQQSANEYGQPKDRYDSFRMQLLRRKDMYGQMLAKALDEFHALEKIDPKQEKEKVEFGAVVITSDQKLFISIGLGKIIFNQTSYYAVSVNVPLCNALVGKGKNEEADWNGKKIKILDIF
jgi:transcription elongation GreA/GreB family factor